MEELISAINCSGFSFLGSVYIGKNGVFMKKNIFEKQYPIWSLQVLVFYAINSVFADELLCAVYGRQ